MSKEYIDMLKQERQVLLDRYDPDSEGTGHFNTAVSVLTARIQELETPSKIKEGSVWVLVEAIMSYRMRYMVEAPATNPEYAMDDVTMEDAKEFSQLALQEVITSHRVLTEDEAITLCDIDNDYTSGWTKEQKIKSFFTKEGEGRGF
jgi:hypothetical protein